MQDFDSSKEETKNCPNSPLNHAVLNEAVDFGGRDNEYQRFLEPSKRSNHQDVETYSSSSSATDSDEESKMHNLHRKIEARKKAQARGSNVPFTADNLIERPGKVLSSLFNQLTNNTGDRNASASQET